MDDSEFVVQIKRKIESTTGVRIDLEIDKEDKQRLAVDLAGTPPKVVFGAATLEHAGLARMYSQYAILCLKERREVTEQEFLLYLRRN